MLEPILGSQNRERVLIFLCARGEGYARQIARFFDTDLFPIQEQLNKLEAGGVLVSRQVGRTVLFEFNPRYPILPDLKSLLEKALSYYPEDKKEQLLMNRRRPRRRGKRENFSDLRGSIPVDEPQDLEAIREEVIAKRARGHADR